MQLYGPWSLESYKRIQAFKTARLPLKCMPKRRRTPKKCVTDATMQLYGPWSLESYKRIQAFKTARLPLKCMPKRRRTLKKCVANAYEHTRWNTMRVGISVACVKWWLEIRIIAMFAMCVFVYTRSCCKSKTNAHDAAKPPPLMSHREKKKYNREVIKAAKAAIAIQCALRVRKAKEEARRRRLDKVANTAQCILNIRRMNAEGNGILLKLQDITTALEKKLRP